MPRPSVAVFLALLMLAPGALAALGAVPAALPLDAPAVRLAPEEALPLLDAVADRLAPLDHGLVRARVLPAVGPMPAVTLLAGGGSSGAAGAPSAGGVDATAGTELNVWSGETRWVNDTSLAVRSIYVAQGGRLVLQNATITFEAELYEGNLYAGGGYVGVHGVLVAENSTLQASHAEAPFYFSSYGTFDAFNLTHRGGSLELWPNGENDTALVERSLFAAPSWPVRLTGNATMRESLFYNATSEALVLGTNATATDNTLVHNNVGVRLEGPGARFEGNVVRFNTLGIQWGGDLATVRGNNLHDNYQDALFGDGQGGATLDASGNWWDGAPNQDGDSYGGTGVSVNSYAATAFALPDRTAELPFRLHSMRGDVTWSGPTTLDGPVIARGGTLTFTDAVIDAQGFRVGSHVGARLQVVNAEFRQVDAIIARTNDAFDGITLRDPVEGGSGIGILAISASPTVRNSHFENLTAGIAAVPRSLTDNKGTLRVESSTFVGTEVGALGALVQPTFTGNTFRGNGIALITILCATVKFERNLVQDSLAGIASVLDQGASLTGNAVYNTYIGTLLAITPSPTVQNQDNRFNGLDTLVLGSQATLTGSNVYDAPFYAIFAADLSYVDPETQARVDVEGAVVVDGSSYVAGSTHGDVQFLPPRKTAPATTTGRSASYDATVVEAGETLTLTGDVVLTGPVVARPGARLVVQDASVNATGFLVGAMAGAEAEIRNATLTDTPGIFLHTAAPVVDNATIRRVMTGVTIVDAENALVRATRFQQGQSGLQLWDSKAEVVRSLFGTDTGLLLANESNPRRGDALVHENHFTGRTAVVGTGNPVGTLRNNSFETSTAVDHAGVGLSSPAQGTGVLDARWNWFNSTQGPRTQNDWNSDGASVRWVEGGPQTVLFDPWLEGAWRATMHASHALATTLDEVRFEDTSFDLDGGIVARRWDFGDGTPGTNASAPTHVFTQHGQYTVRLEVDDAQGRTSVATHEIVVKAAPVAAVDAPAEIRSLDPVRVDAANATDADGSVAAYRFTFSDGTDTGYVAASILEHAFARPGAHWVRVTVQDDEGYESLPVEAGIHVLNRAPLADFAFAPSEPTRADDVAFTSLATDADGDLASLSWDFGDGATATGADVSHRYATLGTFNVTLTVTDDQGATSSMSREVTVVNAPPVADFDAPPRAKPEESVTFTSLATDRDGQTLHLAWSFGDGTTAEGSVVEHVYREEGDFTVTLTATDADGASATATRTIRLSYNEPPVADFVVEPPTSRRLEHVFRDRSTDADGQIVSWRWSFGDGITATTPDATHLYMDAGFMPVRLTVTDNASATSTGETLLVVDDVLVATAALEDPDPTWSDEVVLDVRTRWLNGTGVPATVKVRVYHVDPSASARTPVHEAQVRTSVNGTASLRVPPTLTGHHLPGAYLVELHAWTTEGFLGNFEQAKGTYRYAVHGP